MACLRDRLDILERRVASVLRDVPGAQGEPIPTALEQPTLQFVRAELAL